MPNITLRLPTDLHQALKHASDREHRSLHAEILSRLEPGLEPQAVPSRPAPAASLALCDMARNHRRGAYCKACGQTP